MSKHRYYFRPAPTVQRPKSFFGKDSGGSFFGPHGVQTKLSIGKPGDKYEQEADSVADRVVMGQTASPQLSTQNGGLNRKCEACEQEGKVQRMEEEEPVQAMEEEEEVQTQAEEEEPVQAMEEEEVQAKSNAQAKASANFATRLQARRGNGTPLAPTVRQKMEQGIGADFSGVRIHTDTEAVQMSRSIHAQAFTRGRDVYFNAGKYNPESTAGKRLLAHELTHVVQQGGAGDKVQRNPIGDGNSPVDDLHTVLTQRFCLETRRPWRPGLQYTPEYAAWLSSLNPAKKEVIEEEEKKEAAKEVTPAKQEQKATTAEVLGQGKEDALDKGDAPKEEKKTKFDLAAGGGRLWGEDKTFSTRFLKGSLKVPITDLGWILKDMHFKGGFVSKYKAAIRDEKFTKKLDVGLNAYWSMLQLYKGDAGNFKLRMGPFAEGTYTSEWSKEGNKTKGSLIFGGRMDAIYTPYGWKLRLSLMGGGQISKIFKEGEKTKDEKIGKVELEATRTLRKWGEDDKNAVKIFGTAGGQRGSKSGWGGSVQFGAKLEF